MLEDMGHAAGYLTTTVEWQLRLHSLPGEGLPSQKEKLRRKITLAPLLPDELKQKLPGQLEALAHDSAVCHGDFHPFNLIRTDKGVKIIDWADASRGAPAADACRSYLLYLLHGREAAEGYLQLYCAMAHISREDVLKWMPVIAGARLQETGLGDDESLLLRLAEGDSRY
jgi:Ser/Thr protein kinase RdoA (MazF antagonist)